MTRYEAKIAHIERMLADAKLSPKQRRHLESERACLREAAKRVMGK